jgi:predicted HTH transcriptional regulator
LTARLEQREKELNEKRKRDTTARPPMQGGKTPADRHIEIQSPGGLYGEATPANFPTRSSYRNPVIAGAMKSLGFVNRFGYGVQRAQALLEQNGNPPAEFELDEHSVLVKVYRRPE